jgi:Glutamine amidotransferases class-II
VTSAGDRVAVVATVPLTRDETWQQGVPGMMWVFHRGRLRATFNNPGPGARPAPKKKRARSALR